MKRKEWMSKDNPIRIEGKQVELKELEDLVSYDKNDMAELSVLAQDYMLDIDCKTNEEIIALQESELWLNLCKRLNDLEAKINSKINTLYTVYSQEDSRVEDLATQLSVNKLEHTEELKLNLKKSK